MLHQHIHQHYFWKLSRIQPLLTTLTAANPDNRDYHNCLQLVSHSPLWTLPGHLQAHESRKRLWSWFSLPDAGVLEKPHPECISLDSLWPSSPSIRDESRVPLEGNINSSLDNEVPLQRVAKCSPSFLEGKEVHLFWCFDRKSSWYLVLYLI